VIDSMTNRQKGVTFYVLTLFMAVSVALFGPDEDGPLQILSMVTPTIGVLVMLLVLTPDGYRRAGWSRLALHRPGWRGWPLALMGPAAILGVSYGATSLVGLLRWDFEADIVLNLVLSIVINSLFAVLEEIGWRGYLLPHLGIEGNISAALVVGLLHGVWHLPLMLLTTAYNPAGNRLLTVPVFLAVLTGAGVLYAYLRWTSGSLLPVVVAHGTFNAVLGALGQGSTTADPAGVAYLTGETGIFTLAGVVALAIVLTRRGRRSANSATEHIASDLPATSRCMTGRRDPDSTWTPG
jgi:membrane protease YdiL (CAAX protease family)